MQSNDSKYTRVRELIRRERRKQPPMRVMFLSDLDGEEPDKKAANKFLLGCSLDYQMKVDVVWENARRLADVVPVASIGVAVEHHGIAQAIASDVGRLGARQAPVDEALDDERNPVERPFEGEPIADSLIVSR